MSSTTDFTAHFLIAMPGMRDPRFQHTVTYICEHNENGAMGIVVNRLLDMRLGDLLSHMDIEAPESLISDAPIHQGGPVQTERGFVLHRPAQAWDSTLRITDEIAVTTSRDILEAIAHGDGPDDRLVALGYAGWGPGQLEQEFLDNAWLSGPADNAILFEVPVDQRWQSAAGRLGIDIARLHGDAGHA
ncbi:MAG: YqgE/AlgH family protein [Chromatiales bacterium]|nr:YqgE/AlgH family protein [Chromatiales bacterium]